MTILPTSFPLDRPTLADVINDRHLLARAHQLGLAMGYRSKDMGPRELVRTMANTVAFESLVGLIERNERPSFRPDLIRFDWPSAPAVEASGGLQFANMDLGFLVVEQPKTADENYGTAFGQALKQLLQAVTPQGNEKVDAFERMNQVTGIFDAVALAAVRNNHHYNWDETYPQWRQRTQTVVDSVAVAFNQKYEILWGPRADHANRNDETAARILRQSCCKKRLKKNVKPCDGCGQELLNTRAAAALPTLHDLGLHPRAAGWAIGEPRRTVLATSSDGREQLGITPI